MILTFTRLQQVQAEAETSQQQLRALTHHLSTAIEEERSHIAREIHDELGQALTGLKFGLYNFGDQVSAQLENSTNSQIPAPEELDPAVTVQELTGSINKIQGTVRRIATRLRPLVLDDLGLEAAIDWQLQEFREQTKTACRWSCTLQGKIDGERSTALFRILQEALTNVTRHAQADRVEVQLYESPPCGNRGETVHLEVRDNGRGIRDDEMTGARSLGLLGMRERTRLLGGDLQVTGTPGAGTTVEAWILRASPKKSRKARNGKTQKLMNRSTLIGLSKS